jgi:DNA-binding transcriptional regulator GbsR (MarR family)
MQVSSFQQTFILHFGEMGSRWGINRTVGQIYALLFISEQALNADQITKSLGMSRSNVSMGLKELQSWQLVSRTHQPGDRREYFSAPEDVWDIVETLIRERRKREIDPTISMLRGVQLEKPDAEADRYAQARMHDMLELIEMLTGWLDDLQGLEKDTVIKLVKLGSGIGTLMGAAQRLGGNNSKS